VEVTTATFIPQEAVTMPGYQLLASPTLYSGQQVRAVFCADEGNVGDSLCQLIIRQYNGDDELVAVGGPKTRVRPGQPAELTWVVPDTAGQPVQSVGLRVDGGRSTAAAIHLDELSWDGEPDVVLTRPADGGTMWRRAWIDGFDQLNPRGPEAYRLVQNEGRGLLIQGTDQWHDYEVTATMTPHMAEAFGVAARVQGLRRYYALLVCRDSTVRLIKSLDGEVVLGSVGFDWELGRAYALSLQVTGNQLRASLDGKVLFAVEESTRPLDGGGIALLCEEGRVGCDDVRVRPAGRR
jgi:hypothetical protein